MAKKKSTNSKLRLVSSRAEPATRKPNILVIYNLRTDPYGFADITSNTYGDFWMTNTFTVDDAHEKISAVGGGS